MRREHDREGPGEAVFQVLRRDAGGFLRPDVDQLHLPGAVVVALQRAGTARAGADGADIDDVGVLGVNGDEAALAGAGVDRVGERDDAPFRRARRSEEHTSELQSLMRISYAVFCLKKKKK